MSQAKDDPPELHKRFDPVSLITDGVVAGIQQANDTYSGYGYGAAGYGKRFAAQFGDGRTSDFLSHAVFPALFHQDPRYFYQGTGSFTSRLIHAAGFAIITRSDSGKPMPNYSYFLGDIGSGALSNLYYPHADRGLGRSSPMLQSISQDKRDEPSFVSFSPNALQQTSSRRNTVACGGKLHLSESPMPPLSSILSSAVEKLMFHPVTITGVKAVGESFRLPNMQGVGFESLKWMPRPTVQIFLESFTKRSYTPMDLDWLPGPLFASASGPQSRNSTANNSLESR